MDLNNFEFDKVVLRDVVVLETPMMYFKEDIFGQHELKRKLYHHFDSDAKWTRVKEAHKLEGDLM